MTLKSPFRGDVIRKYFFKLFYLDEFDTLITHIGFLNIFNVSELINAVVAKFY